MESRKPHRYFRELSYKKTKKGIEVSSEIKVDGQKITATGAEAKNIINEMRNIQPSQFTQREAGIPYVRFFHNKYTNDDIKQRSGVEGKWLLCFPKGSEKIDKAWELLVDSVAKGELEQVKVYFAASEGKFQGEQTISVYNFNINDKKAVVDVFERLKKLGLVDLHLSEEMNKGLLVYKTDSQTAANEYGTGAHIHTNQDIDALKKQAAVEDKINKLKTHLEKLIINEISSKTINDSTKKYIINSLKSKDYSSLETNLKFQADEDIIKKSLEHLKILQEITDQSFGLNDNKLSVQDKIDKFHEKFTEREEEIKNAPDEKSAKLWIRIKAILTGLTLGLAGLGFAYHAHKTTGSANFLFKGKHERLRENIATTAEKLKSSPKKGS